MDRKELKGFMDYVRQINLEKLMGHTEQNDVNFPHTNCRSSIEPLPPKMVERVYLDGRRELVGGTGSDRNTVVSWESLSAIIGADTVQRITRVS